MNTTRSHSKQPSPSDTEYEIARVRGDALVRCSPHCKQRVVQVPPAKSRSSRADTPSSIPLATMAAIPASQESVNRVALDRTRSQPLNTFAEVREMVSIQRDGVQHFDPAKIITGAGVRVSDLSIDDALAELLGAIACTPQTADATDANLTGSMFAAFASADGSTAVKTAAAVAVICKLVTERLWPATSDGVPHGGMRKLDGFLLLPIRKRHPAPPSPHQQKAQQPPTHSPQQQKYQQPPTPPASQETEDSMLGKHPRDDLSDTNDSDTSGAGATLLTTITPARQVRLTYIYNFHVAAQEI